MLRGMVGSIMSRLAGDDPVVLQAMRDDPEMMQRMADPRVVLAMESINTDPEKLLDFQDDLEVMELLDSVARLSGGSTYALQRRLEEAELARAEELAEEGLGELEEGEEAEAAEDDEEERARRREAKRRFAEVQRHRSERARREVVTKAAPLTYDVKDWESKPWFERSHEMGAKLAEKGFCVLRGSLEAEHRQKAIVEAQRLQRSGGFTRPPREVLSGLFGDIGSAWTRELSDPNQPAPPEDEALRAFDYQLEELGGEIAGVTDAFFGMKIKGRTVGVAHLSRMAADSSNPPLVDAEEADGYMMLFMRKKVKMIYYVGPGTATMRIFPIDEAVKDFKTTLEAGTIVALRGDVCRCIIDPLASQVGVIVEVDYLAIERLGPQENVRDRVPPPEEILVWYEQRLKAIVDNDVVDSVPDDWVMLARSSFYKAKRPPIDILEINHALPATAVPEESWLAPFAACTLGGSDSISEIPSSKWDMDVYFDEDPMNVDNFKMYTRHLGLLPGAFEFNPADFGLTLMEAANVDPRYLKLCQSSVQCLQLAGLSKDSTQGTDLGVFLGVSGNEMQYQMITREARLSKCSLANTSNATIVNRLTYLLGSTGPSISVDTEDSSGSAALDNSMTFLRAERCSMALTGSISLIQHPLSLIVHCAAGTISWTGRCRVFDETSDGVVRSEGVVSVMLKPRDSKGLGTQDDLPDRGAVAMLMGSGLNSKGVSSSLTAPSGPAINDVLQRALRDASYPACMIQGVDLNANGFNLGDSVEMGVMQKALLNTGTSGTRKAVVLRNFKSVHGETGGPGGLASLAKAFFFLTRAVHGPCLHLHELSEILESATDDDEQGDLAAKSFIITTECLEAANVAHHAGINSFSTSGTNVHHIVWGTKPEEDRPIYGGQTLHWFPTCGEPMPASEGGQSEASLPEKAEYYVIGSFNAWREPLRMQEESPGVWTYVVKLGENRWESFQIWVNGNKNRILHPAGHRVSQGSRDVLGPSAQDQVGRMMTWAITGKPDKVILVNEEQVQNLQYSIKETGDMADFVTTDMDGLPVLAFSGSYKPKGYENVEDLRQMPTMVRNKELVGRPGDLYKIRLLLSAGGKYRKMEWSKLDASYPPRLGQDFEHAYYITGDYSYWTFSQMEAADEGVYTARLQLLTKETEFVIARDKDWDQTFGPKKKGETGQDASTCLGPRVFAMQNGWKIEGEPGDVFAVKFSRRPTDGDEDDLSISWEFVANEPGDSIEVAKDLRYTITGSWNDFMKQRDMEPNEDRSAFSTEVIIGESGMESFQITFQGKWFCLVHPNTSTASFRDEGHEVQGPDRNAAERVWVIGRDAEDEAEEGSHFRVTLEIVERFPRKIRWEKLAPEQWTVMETAITQYRDEACQIVGGRPGEEEEEDEDEDDESSGDDMEALPPLVPQVAVEARAALESALADRGGAGTDT